ncbi:MAG: hypothetical protein JXR42_02950 [Gammaproteobacteria bacterium]|nr:hypothetical protein [Gammaproteobacteria bacterium]
MAQTFGNIASNLFGEELAIHGIIQVVCVITGCALILSALMLYRKHRKNPMHIHLSQVFMTLLIGIAMLALYFIPLPF